MKILIDITADGYLTREEERAACREMVEDYLNSAAITTKILWDETSGTEKLLENIDYYSIKI